MKKAIIICGPTAGGKTDLAHNIALNCGGEIVNADSMQVYKQLPIITASPSKQLKSEINYHLYNFIDVDQDFSVAKYIKHASSAIIDIESRGKLPIIVGGSGMYINMLTNGYNHIPDIDPQIRISARNLWQELGAEKFYQELTKLDLQIATTLNCNDSQRLIRAYEVFKQTGKSILFFQNADKIKPLSDFSFEIFCLFPERDFLYSMCKTRLEKMFDKGVSAEIKNVITNYKVNNSAMKVLGVREIIFYLQNKIDQEKAKELTVNKTRQYAKRQITWFKNQLNDKKIIEFTNINEYKENCNKIIDSLSLMS